MRQMFMPRVLLPSEPKELNLNPGNYIIMLKEGEKYLPAENPKVLTTERQAMHVAKAMARKHGGIFVAFKAIGEAERPQIEPTVRRYV